MTNTKKEKRMRVVLTPLMLFACCALLSCSNPDEPQLSLFTLQSIQTIDENFDCNPIAITNLQEGRPIYIGHLLPENVEPIGELKISVETPCGQKKTIIGTHSNSGDLTKDKIENRKLALESLTVPKGGQCGLTITASILNSNVSCVYSPNSSSIPAECLNEMFCTDNTDESSTDSNTAQ